MKLPILSCCLHGPNSQHLDLPCPEYLQESAQRLRDDLEAQFRMGGVEPPQRCWLEFQLSEELGPDDRAPLDRSSHSLQQVLKGLRGPLARPEGKVRLKARLLKMFPELEGTGQLDRLVQEAMEFSARGLGLNLAAQSELDTVETRSRRRIFSCPDCDLVFIDAEGLEVHRQVHNSDASILALVQAEFQLRARFEVSFPKAPAGIKFTSWLTNQKEWEWRLEGRLIVSGYGGPEKARSELLKVLGTPGLAWLGDAVLQKQLVFIESAYPGLIQHSLWQPGLTLRDLRCLLQRLDASGWTWQNWLTFLEAVPEAVVLCRERAGLAAGPLTAVQLDQLRDSMLEVLPTAG